MTASPIRRLGTACLVFCITLLGVSTILGALAPHSSAADAICSADGDVIATLSATGDVTFTNQGDTAVCVGIASYERPSGDIEDQILFDSRQGAVPARGTLHLSIRLPDDCNYQLDAFRGSAIVSFKDGVRYNNDGRLLAYRLQSSMSWCTAEPATTTTVEPTTTTTVEPTTTTTVEPAVQLIPPLVIEAPTTTTQPTTSGVPQMDPLPATGVNAFALIAIAVICCVCGVLLVNFVSGRAKGQSEL